MYIDIRPRLVASYIADLSRVPIYRETRPDEQKKKTNELQLEIGFK